MSASREGWHGWDDYAPFYDWESAQTVQRRDVGFWQRLAARIGSPVIELGCGTGRVLLPVARTVEMVIGVDRSSDGWAWGGPATLVSTLRAPNNKRLHYDVAGSEHGQIVHVLMADGSVRIISENIEITTWRNLGNMANGIPVSEF